MKSKIRSLLYHQTKLKPAFNPMDVPEDMPTPSVIDLTLDVTNTSRIYHPNTEQVREYISYADAIVCDTQAQASIVKMYRQPSKPVIIAPFGFSPRKDVDNGEFTVGIMNHEPDDELNNASQSSRKIIEKLGYRYLVYGSPLGEAEEQVTTDDFEDFAARCDVILLTSLRDSVNDLTLPLSAMLAGSILVAPNNGGYNALRAASGVFFLESNRIKDWKTLLSSIESQPIKLQTLKDFNVKYARNISSESLSLISRLERVLAEKTP